MRSLKLPEKYYRDILIDSLFSSYLNSDEATMNMTKFCDDCLNIREDNNFMEFKDKNLQYFKEKINNQLVEKEKITKELEEEKKGRLQLQDELVRQIQEKQNLKKKFDDEENNKSPTVDRFY